MALSSRKRFLFNSLYFVILWLCGSDGGKTDFRIYRSEQDIFTNPEGDRASACSSYDAKCMPVKGNECDYCRCLEGKNTLVNSGGTMKCMGDENLVPESVPEDKFLLNNSIYSTCLKLDGSGIIGTKCSSPTLDMFWIWTSTRNKQLMNVKTLTCMNRSAIMTQCEDKNTVKCVERGTAMQIWGRRNHFLHLPSRSHVVFKKNSNQQWSSNLQNSCKPKTAYNGCYRFSDGSFLKYLNYSNPLSKLSISAPIFKTRRTGCQISRKFKYSRDNHTGESDTGDIFSLRKKSGKIVEIQFATMKHFNTWNGSLLNISVVFGREEKHCVLLKLESKPSFLEVMKSTPTPSTVITTESTTPSRSSESSTENKGTKEAFRPETTSEKDKGKSIKQDKKDGTSSEPSRTSKTSTTVEPLQGGRNEVSQSGGTNSTVIAVIVVLTVVALALALGILVYRRRRRAQVPQNKNNVTVVVNYSPGIYEDPYRIYETLEDDKKAVTHHDLGPPCHTYSSPDNSIIANPPSNEQEYTYAKETDFPRSSARRKPEAKEQINNGCVYETLDQPGEPNYDSFYNYPENTNVTKPPVSDLEYTYAKDSDIPRITVDETMPGKPASNPVYQTLEQEQAPTKELYKNPGADISTELEYTYAKDTEIPRITVDETMPGKPASNPVYQTIEKESPPTKDLYKHPGADVPIELEYTYAKDTEIPRISIDTSAKRDGVPATGTEQRHEHSTPENDSALYHTLEESKPSQPPVYSTLDGPDDIDQ